MDSRAFSLVEPDLFRRVADHVLGFIKERTGRNEPCPCGSGRKYKTCCLTKDTGGERLERLLAATPLPPASMEYEMPGITEHVAYALRAQARLGRQGPRFDSLAADMEPVEWAVGAVHAAASQDPAIAAARAVRALQRGFDPCLDYVALVRLAAPSGGPESESLHELAVRKAETYLPHPLSGGDFLVDARAHYALFLAGRGKVREAAKLLEALPGVESVSATAAANAATVALGLDRGDLCAAIVAPHDAEDAAVAPVLRLAASRALPSGMRLVPTIPRLWAPVGDLPTEERRCPLCGVTGLRATRASLSAPEAALFCLGCRVVAIAEAPNAADAPWPDYVKDVDALQNHLALPGSGSMP